MPRVSYVNGRYVAHARAAVHVEDRGFQFADGAYEVIAVIGGVFADERGHLDRLERSLGELRIDMPCGRKSLQMILRETLRRNRLRDAAVYIQVTRGTAPRDFKFPDGARPSLIVTARPADFDLAKRKSIAKKAVTVPDIRWKRRDIKSIALLGQVLAKQSAVEQGAYEALMIDDDGLITEGASTNVWIVDKKGALITRPTANNMILKGVTRAALQSLFPVVERPFTPREVYAAAEVFTSAAVTMIVPIVEVDGHKIGSGKMGAVTEKVMELYLDYARYPENAISWESA